MQTTLNEIKKYNPNDLMWQKLSLINSTDSSDFMAIFETVGIEDAIWCLRVLDYKDYCLFLADVAESVLYLFESEYLDNKTSKEAIQAIRDWYNGDITKEQLEAYAYAAYYTYTTYGATYADYTVKRTAFIAAYAAAGTFDAGTAVRAAANVYANIDYKSNWKKIEELFIKHFGGRTCKQH